MTVAKRLIKTGLVVLSETKEHPFDKVEGEALETLLIYWIDENNYSVGGLMELIEEVANDVS